MGDSLFALRFFPAVFAAAHLLLTGLTARAMGGRRYAQVLTCVCVLAAPQFFGTFLNTDIFMELGWAACAWVAARIFAREDERLWLLFGVFAGLAMQGKHAMAFFGVAFLVGLLISPQRKILLSKWLWAGIGITFLISLPNLIWEYQHHWATYELLTNIARSDKNLVLSPLAYLRSNIDSLGRFSLPVWLAGLFWLLAAKDGRRFRALGWTWIAALIIFLVLKGKDYYLTPVYPMLYAGGAVAIESWLAVRKRAVALTAKVALTLLVALDTIGWPMAMPMMPVEKFIAYEEALHVAPKRTETAEVSRLPQQYADMFGWKEAAAAVAVVYNRLPAEERGMCGIFTRNYGEAGAIDYFGPALGLPKSISGHQNYWLWGPGPYTGECLIVVGGSHELLDPLFVSVTQAGELYQQYAMPFENHRPIWIVHGVKQGTLRDIWPKLKLWY
jgi:4-amino-4-deoxy-L-arabinose transferase-like glycosyltransferase